MKPSLTYRDGTAYVPDEGAHLVALSVETRDVEWRTRPYDSVPGDRRATTPTVAGDTLVVLAAPYFPQSHLTETNYSGLRRKPTAVAVG